LKKNADHTPDLRINKRVSRSKIMVLSGRIKKSGVRITKKMNVTGKKKQDQVNQETK